MLIKDFPTYHIFRNGAILSEKRNSKFLKAAPNAEGYMMLNLCKNGDRKPFYLQQQDFLYYKNKVCCRLLYYYIKYKFI